MSEDFDLDSKNNSDLRDEVKEILSNQGKGFEIKVTQSVGEASKEKCDKVLQSLANDKKCSIATILIGISHLLQQGGTSKKVNNEVSITVGEVRITMGEMQRKCADVGKISPRQFARGLKYEISDVMELIGESFPEGNQSKAIQMDILDLSKEELQWASDFQSYNERCPERIRSWLIESYRKRFRKDFN